MKPITFIDTEVEPKSGKILDMGAFKPDGSTFHSNSSLRFIQFLQGTRYICGHNIINHDIKYINDILIEGGLEDVLFIDTLYLSPLLFPAKPYHSLLKDDKLQTDDINNPLNDSVKAKDLFFDEVVAFNRLDEMLKGIYYELLKERREFCAFFHFMGMSRSTAGIEDAIHQRFRSQICDHANLKNIIENNPIQLAYCLALINANDRHSITPPWVLRNFPQVENVMFLLRNNPCVTGCSYCHQALDIHRGLKQFFGFDLYRTYGGEPLQEEAVKAAVANKSLLAVFPTGGGKSIAFQVPALMSGANAKGLTVVLSPLQSLMKDQVDNLERAGIIEAVTVNGLLNPIERAKSLERVENGSASILYIAPESLRSKTIERLLLGRNIIRFVIDEAHCFSTWGQDFRVDYLYIGDFIKSLQEKKNLKEGIPVSCFTATAKQKVIEDIREYFKEKLSIEMEVFNSTASRTNLSYKVFMKDSDEDKYNTVRDLIEEKKCPTIVYVSRTRRADYIAERLVQDGYKARPYHGQMDKREKSENQDAFINGDVQIMVATSAFGMGVDKKDVGMVIHYEVSDSLENYVQEAGRAGRDESISAECYVLFNDEDLNKHFILLNQTKLNVREIQQIWKAIKDLTRMRSRVSQSALEIANMAGWDVGIREIETRVMIAIAALEDAGYLKRGQNMPRVFADSILTGNATEAIDKINGSGLFNDEQKEQGIRIIKMLISAKSRKHTRDDGAESRIDYISDRLGIEKGQVIEIVHLLRQVRILADAKDLIAFIKRSGKENSLRYILNSFYNIENFLLNVIGNEEKTLNLKELNEQAEQNEIAEVSTKKIKTILNIWAITGWIKKRQAGYSNNHVTILPLQDKEQLVEKLEKRHGLAKFIMEYLHDIAEFATGKEVYGNEVLVEFSVLELKEKYEDIITLFNNKATAKEIEDTLFYLSKIGAIKIEGGFMIIYSPLTIERLEQDNKKRYKLEDYRKLSEFYENKIQQIHIVGEYAYKMIDDYKAALQFVDDYFQLNYSSFLNKYFKGSRRNEIKRNITPPKFKQLFGELSPTQLKIINDKDSKYIVVAAGPGSGKTRILVHKLASLLLMEDVRHEQLLMLTFSRSATTEFKRRLLTLIGNAANFVEIKTFHSYCFDLLGRVGTLEKSDKIIQEAIDRIKTGEVDINRITKTVMVIDEAQDMDEREFQLISTLIEHNEEMRIIAVGDDDQNIFEFRGSSSKYLRALIDREESMLYELVDNYRSKANLVDFSNQFIKRIPNRLKKTPIMAVQGDNGKIKVVRYSSRNLITPLVKDILSEGLSGNTCVLTKTNEEAMQITGLLIKNGMHAKLIQSNDGFSLYNLLEIRFFINRLNLREDVYVIDNDTWAYARKHLVKRFPNSPNLEICINMIKDFESTNPRYKYKSDIEAFIRESKLEDFYGESIETIFVSTIHKAKGREFDNVFLMLDRFGINSVEAARQLYVAMTRAKRNLFIHYNGKYLDYIKAEGLESIEDPVSYQRPEQVVMQLSFKDVWLDYFLTRQGLISDLDSGDELIPDDDCCRNTKGQIVLKYSKQAVEQIETLKQNNYVLTSAKIRFILYWKKEDLDYEIRVLLPELYFKGMPPGKILKP